MKSRANQKFGSGAREKVPAAAGGLEPATCGGAAFDMPDIFTGSKTVALAEMFMSYQKDRIRDISRYVIDEKARRIGLTFAYAFKYALKRAATPGKTWVPRMTRAP